MAKKSGVTIGRLLLQLALGAMLAVAGILSFQGHGDDAVGAIRAVFDGNVENVLVVVFGVIELLAGIFLIVELFVGDKIGKVTKILNWVIIIIFAVIIVISDLLNGSWNKDFLNAAYNLSKNLVFLGGMWYLND